MNVEIVIGDNAITLKAVPSLGQLFQHGGVQFTGDEVVSHTIAPNRNPFLARDLDAMMASAAGGEVTQMWIPAWMLRYVRTKL